MSITTLGDAGDLATAELAPEAAGIEGRTPLQLAWHRFKQDRVAVGAGVFILVLVAVALLAPVITAVLGRSPYTLHADGLTSSGIPVGPSPRFWLGTDDVGRDVFARVIYGARISLLVGVAATGVALLVGVSVGLTAGYFGGKVDFVLSRVMDVVISFPFLLTAFALVTIFSPSVWISIAVIALFTWVQVARIVRGQVLSVREKEYIEAARSLGASDVRIMVVDVLPNLVAPIIVYATVLIPSNILFEATLSFLGLGVKIPVATWGNMLAEATDSAIYQIAWWFMLFPGLALLATVLAFNLLGDGVRDALDPRARQVMAK